MTISSQLSYLQAACNGVAKQFAFPNKIFAGSDLIVTLIDVIGNLYAFNSSGFNAFSNAITGLSYVVSNVDVDTGCFITFSGPPNSDWTVDMRTAIAELQSTSIKNQGGFLPELHEEFFDKATRMLQDLKRLTYTFGIHGPDNELIPWTQLPNAAGRANLALMFDNDGLPTVGNPGTGAPYVYVAPYTGSVQRSLTAKLADIISVLDFGADKSGVTSAVSAIILAINAAGNAGGGIVVFPPGLYLWDSPNAVAIPAGVTLLGMGRNASVMITDIPNASMFYVNGLGAAVRGLGFASSVSATGGTWVYLAGQNNTMDDFAMTGDFNGVTVIGVSSTLSNGYFTVGAMNAQRIVYNCGDAAPSIFNITMAAQPAPYPASGVLLLNCGSMLATNLEIINQGACLAITPGNGQNCSSNDFIASFFDSGTYGVYAQPSGNGAISRLTFIDTWGGDGSSGGWLFNNAGTGVFSGVSLIECQGCVNGGAGLSLNGAITNVKVIGGTYAQNASDGIAAAHVGDFKAMGVNSGAYGGLAGNTGFGINVRPSVTSTSVIGCDMVGNTLGDYNDAAGAGIPRVVKGNLPIKNTGFGAPTGAVLTTNFPGATATLVQTSEMVAKVLAIMIANGDIAA